MINRTTRPLVESAMLTAVTIIMAIMGTALPMFFFLLYILPIPIAVNIFRHGLRWGVISIAASALIAGSVFGIYSAVTVITVTIFVSPALGIGFRRFSPTKNLIITIAASLISIALALGAAFLIMGVNFLTDFQTALNTATQASIEIYKTMGLTDADIQSQSGQIEKIVKLIMLSLPAGIALSAVGSAFVNFILTQRLLKRLGERTLAGLPAFAQWHMPIIFLFLFGFSLVGMYWGSTRDISLLYNVSFNINYFSSMFCRLQGLSLLYCALQHFKLPTAPKIMIMVLVIFTPFMEIFMYVGLFDMIFDYRARFAKGRNI
ncbi:YybS family protein [Pectinatus frisingensis]|jgi:uncharacterized protein YybS (DUF2232 family)|uniref:YybS family protein n=1 Tax=Pectinatus frisingensis TaxID=865 RepID=UPI0018C70173|nr:DUF2232 domain-containing protein [Pectinatus frisingensis]